MFWDIATIAWAGLALLTAFWTIFIRDLGDEGRYFVLVCMLLSVVYSIKSDTTSIRSDAHFVRQVFDQLANTPPAGADQ